MRIVFIIMIVFLSCKGAKNTDSQRATVDFSNPVNAQVKKIDSIDNYYLIYCRNGGKNYKIVSRKMNFKSSCKTIKVDSSYDFKLLQLTNVSSASVDSEIPTPINYLDIEKCIFKENTKICNEPKTELYEAKNLNGLCIVKTSDAN